MVVGTDYKNPDIELIARNNQRINYELDQNKITIDWYKNLNKTRQKSYRVIKKIVNGYQIFFQTV